MSTNVTQTLLKYAEIQLAAEAIFSGEDEKAKTDQTPSKIRTNLDVNISNLRKGNYRSSRFTEVEAIRFDEHWDLVEQISNTGTGFSGSLFRCMSDDPLTGAKAGELVMSFRSTEFLDDAVRDNQATNTLEIKDLGWALGQIADMNKSESDPYFSPSRFTCATDGWVGMRRTAKPWCSRHRLAP